MVNPPDRQKILIKLKFTVNLLLPKKSMIYQSWEVYVFGERYTFAINKGGALKWN